MEQPSTGHCNMSVCCRLHHRSLLGQGPCQEGLAHHPLRSLAPFWRSRKPHPASGCVNCCFATLPVGGLPKRKVLHSQTAAAHLQSTIHTEPQMQRRKRTGVSKQQCLMMRCSRQSWQKHKGRFRKARASPGTAQHAAAGREVAQNAHALCIRPPSSKASGSTNPAAPLAE